MNFSSGRRSSNSRVPKRQYILVAAALLLGIILFSGTRYIWNLATRNKLALGSDATVSGAVKIDLNAPVAFGGMPTGDVLAARREAISKHAELLVGSYTPSSDVFGGLSGGLPWFGLKGLVLGRGEASLEGPSTESRYVMNPFLLVAAEFWGLTRVNGGNLRWDPHRATKHALEDPHFPFYCDPQNLVWDPAKSNAKVAYNLDNYIDAVNAYTLEPLTPQSATFGLVGYNARDLGFRFIYLDSKRSSGIANDKDPGAPVRISDHLRGRKKSCGVPGGCNASSNPIASYDQIKVVSLPATAVVDLWRDPPASAEDPDMVFSITLQ